MASASPPLCIGLPVFNGERYLAGAIESLLAQTYTDFSLVLVDNASADATPDICRRYQALDRRVAYHRNERNIGAAGNWYRALDLCDAPYFKWAADDDEYLPTFLERCMSVIREATDVALCYSRVVAIDDEGRQGARLHVAIDTASSSPSVRLANCIAVDYLSVQLYGVMRTEVIRSVARYSGYVGEDRNVLAEICLRGRVVEIPEYLFLHRLSPRAWGARVTSPDATMEELLAYDPTINWKANRLAPLRRAANYLAAVGRVPLPLGERLKCYGAVAGVMGGKVMGRFHPRRAQHPPTTK